MSELLQTPEEKHLITHEEMVELLGLLAIEGVTND